MVRPFGYIPWLLEISGGTLVERVSLPPLLYFRSRSHINISSRA